MTVCVWTVKLCLSSDGVNVCVRVMVRLSLIITLIRNNGTQKVSEGCNHGDNWPTLFPTECLNSSEPVGSLWVHRLSKTMMHLPLDNLCSTLTVTLDLTPLNTMTTLVSSHVCFLMFQLCPTLWRPMRPVRRTSGQSPSRPAPRDSGFSLNPTRETVGRASRSHTWLMMVRGSGCGCTVECTVVCTVVCIVECTLVCTCCVYSGVYSGVYLLFLCWGYGKDFRMFSQCLCACFLCCRGLPGVNRRHSQRWKIIRFRKSPGNSQGMVYVNSNRGRSKQYLLLRWTMTTVNIAKSCEF